MYFSINDGHLSIEVSRNTDLADGLEGFCAFGRNDMVARDGNRYNETTDFLRSWRYCPEGFHNYIVIKNKLYNGIIVLVALPV